MLKGIPSLLSPELLKIMMEMGHGDELVIADGNFPCFAHPKRTLRADGHGIPEILDAILRFFPLDTYVEHPVTFMEVEPGNDYLPAVWDAYREILRKHENPDTCVSAIGKNKFYERAANAYAVVATSESALYANLIIRKGTVTE